jgi:uncharacterized protein YgiM (DUF1202 family)
MKISYSNRMKLFETKHLIALLGVLALVFSGCASSKSKPTARQFEAPATIESGPAKGLFSKALKAQNEGQFDSATKLWKSFLSKHPDSFEGHNNLGLVYYTQDRVSQALQEFETAYRLEPTDPRIRKNLARGLRFKASMLHENREYFKTLEILTRLEEIVEPEEKQGILFKQEQVEDQIYLQVIKANNSAAYQDFVDRFPDGLNAVRAREYLAEHPYKASRSASGSTSRAPKTVSQKKSWISSGKAVADPSADTGDSSWASSEKPPEYNSRPTATYTPPPAGASKKTGDFFGSDTAAVEKAPVNTDDPVAAIPFEDFEKPERASGDPMAGMNSTEGKERRAVADEFSPTREEPDQMAAGLDTLPDLEPSQVAALPAEMDAPPSADTSTGEIEMQPAEPQVSVEEKTIEESDVSQESESDRIARILKEEMPQEESVQESVESESERIERLIKEKMSQAESELPEQTQPEPAPEIVAEPQMSPEEKTMVEPVAVPEEEVASTESAAPESVESESERIARVVSEELAKAEGEQTEEPQSEPAPEAEVEPQVSPEEQPMEVAALDPEGQDAKPEAVVPVETPTVEETPATPDPEEKQKISQETVSETVAALIPSLPQTTPVETPMESTVSSETMVVVQMSEGSTLNVRSQPSTQGEILGYLENGDMMPLQNESGDWYQIEIEEGLSGWISKKYSSPRKVDSMASLPEPEEAMESELTPLGEKPKLPENAMVIVTVSEESTLNVRSLPSSSGAVVDMLFGGDKLPLVKEEGDWYQVQFEDETTGWISKKFSAIEGAVKASIPAPVEKQASPWASDEEPKEKEMVTTVVVIKVPEGSSLNVRSAPSSQGTVVGSLKRGDMRPLMEETDEWYQLELQDGQSGWVSQKFSGKMSVGSDFVQP